MSRIKQPIGSQWRFGLGFIGIFLVIGIYSWLSHQQHIRNPDDTTIPNLFQLIDGWKLILTSKDNPLSPVIEQGFYNTWFYQDVLATYGRLLKGLLWGCGISAVLGIFMGCYEWIASLFSPILSFLSKVPGTAMLAVFFVLAGTGETMFITMIGFGILPILTQSIYLAVKYDLHPEEIDKAYTLGASHAEVIWNVVFKQILPKLLESVRLQIGPAMVFLIAAEMLVGQIGIGYRIRMQQRLMHMNVVYDYLIFLGLTGLLIDKGMIKMRVWLCPWYSKME